MFESLKESIIRRLKKLDSDDISFSAKPDLILIDGGKGQINTCRDIIKSFNQEIDVISLAKKQEETIIIKSLQSWIPNLIASNSKKIILICYGR